MRHRISHVIALIVGCKYQRFLLPYIFAPIGLLAAQRVPVE